MGDHCQYGMAPEWSEGDLQRPTTASSTTLNDLDSTFSSNSSTQGESFGMELARLEEPVVTGTTGYEIDSGIQWSRVLPALNLLRNAVYEAQQPRADGQLVRSLYTGAIGYLLDALPTDLNQDEASRIQQNIPGHLGACSQARLDGNGRSGGIPAAGDRPRRSYIHRTVASIIIYIFLALKLIAPLIKSMAYSLYQYERSHRVTERVAGVAMGAAQTCARYGVNMGSAILRKDGTPTGGMTVSATDEERLPPGGFSLRHGFPHWFGRAKRSGINSTASSRAVSVDGAGPSGEDDRPTNTEDSPADGDGVSAPDTQAQSEGDGDRAGDPTVLSSEEKAPDGRTSVPVAVLLDYIRSTFDDETVLDSLPLEAAGNPSAWHAWKAHRREGNSSGLAPGTKRGSPQARQPGDWHWDGIWAKRVAQEIEASHSDATLFGNVGTRGGTDELIRFSRLDEATLNSVKDMIIPRVEVEHE
ncbi:hypothetical protein ATERTT37_007082 [Aspergillus terreus]